VSSTAITHSANPPAARIDPDSLAALPRACGVYIFRGEGTLPLYVGKSVDIRARVRSHLRAPDEARMVAQTRRIDFIATAGELGALLLESRLIKTLSPLFNIRLRRSRGLCTVQLAVTPKGLVPRVVSAGSVQLGLQNDLYGLFTSVRAAQAALRALADTHGLCLGLLGLEKLTRGACFGHQLKTCLGACAGLEPRVDHDARLLAGLQDIQVHAWPHAGEIELSETLDGWRQSHRINHWRHLGTWCSKSGQYTEWPADHFDLDTYKILLRPVLQYTPSGLHV
jgi:excinuclease Cho